MNSEYAQMQLVHRAERVALCKGDARNLSLCKDNSVDAIVTDPPYGLEFMGKEWDTFKNESRSVQGTGGTNAPFAHHAIKLDAKRGNEFYIWCLIWAKEAFRVLKPGGHIIAFGGTRTYHRLVCAIEDAGFEIRDQIDWLYGNGFPKSVNIGLKFDEAAGVERVKTATVGIDEKSEVGEISKNLRCPVCGKARQSADSCRCPRDNGPQTELAKKYDGYGTALKPAHEPAVLARKPLIGTVVENMSKYGTGAMNIDSARVAKWTNDDYGRSASAADGTVHSYLGLTGENTFSIAARDSDYTSDKGRFPANIILDEYMAEKLDAQIGKARFFYVAKPSRRERDIGLEPKGNIHPTVKPIRLMRYLCKLICPTGGLILDPFLGSGSTGIAALADGFRFLGVDLDDDGRYLEIAKARIDASRVDPTFTE